MAKQNKDKNRKSESQEIFEQADNAGRFAGNDADAKAARKTANDNITQDAGSDRSERNSNREDTNAEAGRDPSQSQDYKGEAQNVEDDGSGRLKGNEASGARNKSTEGIRQGRDED